jgi:hypothetical protein
MTAHACDQEKVKKAPFCLALIHLHLLKSLEKGGHDQDAAAERWLSIPGGRG